MGKTINRMPEATAFARGAFDIVAGIDPDISRSGFALLDVRTRELRVCTLPFPELMDRLREVRDAAAESGRSLRVVVEASYLVRGNWHVSPRDSKAAAAAKGRSVGMNHQTGALICEMCRHMGIRVSEAAPLPKIWRGRDRKITHEELCHIAGEVGRTNQDGRDAALLAWVSAGLPLKVKPL
jgi:hypothetical protein